MDIRTKAVAETGTLHLRDASDELLFDGENKVTVTLYGPGSKVWAKAKTEQSNRLIDRMKKKGKTDQSPEEAAREKANFLADITHSWGHMEYDGKQGRELSLAIYSDQSIGFIADQVAKYVDDWANFPKDSQKT